MSVETVWDAIEEMRKKYTVHVEFKKGTSEITMYLTEFLSATVLYVTAPSFEEAVTQAYNKFVNGVVGE